MKTHLEIATEIAREAGAIIKENFSLGMKREWKGNNTPVTETDLRVNRLVIDKIAEYFPDHSVRGEEESSLKEGSEFVWVCDPVDGTVPFSHGAPISTFSLGLAHNGIPIVAVVYDPFMERLFTAEKGKGAFLNGQRISVSKASDIKNTVVGIEWWKNCAIDYPEIIKKLSELDAQVLRFCSVIYKGMLVACGEASAVIFPGWEPHDMITVKLVVEEAGGKVTDLYGNEQRYDQLCKGMVASNGAVHQSVLEAIGPISF